MVEIGLCQFNHYTPIPTVPLKGGRSTFTLSQIALQTRTPPLKSGTFPHLFPE